MAAIIGRSPREVGSLRARCGWAVPLRNSADHPVYAVHCIQHPLLWLRARQRVLRSNPGPDPRDVPHGLSRPFENLLFSDPPVALQEASDLLMRKREIRLLRCVVGE